MSERAQLSLFDLIQQPTAIIKSAGILDIELFCRRCKDPLPVRLKRPGKKPEFCDPCRRLHDCERRRNHPGYEAKRNRINEKKAAEIAARPVRFCLTCSNALEYPRRKFCGKICTDRYYSNLETQQIKDRFGGEYPTLQCHECEADFVAVPFGPRPRKYCSQACSKKSISRLRCKARRAATYTDIWEFVDPTVIFRRDNWTCQQCGCETPAFKRGSIEDDAPEMDHIIPLARGGPHTEENCRCSCRQCNLRKGALLDEELEELAA